MKILSIETSCDETAICIVEATGPLTDPVFEVLGNSLFSQIAHHTPFGGVVPTLAKREHAKNLSPLLLKTLTEAGMNTKTDMLTLEETWKNIETILIREEGLYSAMRESLTNIEKPLIDCIAVTSGPGLEPALWVGISFAIALGKLWGLPVLPINHMEGHIASVLLHSSVIPTEQDGLLSIEIKTPSSIRFPALALLISGGHTEIVSLSEWGKYTVIGQTRDDAVGEAFDKVARLLGLPYPGGPEISRLAKIARAENLPHICKLPRPMIHSKNLEFSFSGIKTSVLYYIRDLHIAHPEKNSILTEEDKKDIAREFEDAVTNVLHSKITQAIKDTAAQTLIVAGGVISNIKLQETFMELEKEYAGLKVLIPEKNLATDNAVMIACAAYIQTLLHPELLSGAQKTIIAQGNLKLG